MTSDTSIIIPFSDKLKKNSELEYLNMSAQAYFMESLSPATRKAYATDWRCFLEFCEIHGYTALGCDTAILTLFLTQQAEIGKAPQTLQRRLAAIKFMHELSGVVSPINDKMIAIIMKGIRRKNATRPKATKDPLRADMLDDILRFCDTDTLQGLRDKAILLFGFSGAFRRSEICAVQMDDLEETPEGLKVFIRSSKGDQMGEGQIVALPHGTRFPVTQTLKQWVRAAGIHEGYVFRSVRKGGKSVGTALEPLYVAQIIKKYLQKAGYDSSLYAAHSLRSGFLTEAAEHGASLFKMLEVSRHKSTDTLMHYIRVGNLFKDHAGKGFL